MADGSTASLRYWPRCSPVLAQKPCWCPERSARDCNQITGLSLRSAHFALEPRQGQLQAFEKCDLRLPAQHLFGQRCIGTSHLWIVDRPRMEFDPGLGTDHRLHALGKFEDRYLLGIPEIHWSVVVRQQQPENAFDQVIDVTQGPRLRPVAVDRKRASLEGGLEESRDRTTVVDPHPRPVVLKIRAIRTDKPFSL